MNNFFKIQKSTKLKFDISCGRLFFCLDKLFTWNKYFQLLLLICITDFCLCLSGAS